jgi:hypothetical protein
MKLITISVIVEVEDDYCVEMEVESEEVLAQTLLAGMEEVIEKVGLYVHDQSYEVEEG